MPNINFTIGVDNTKGLAGVSQFRDSVNSLSKEVGGEITRKLKMLFSAAAIEESVRRTGEWAQALSQSSKEIGIGTEALQLLQNLAKKTGTPEDAVVGMFKNIAKARQEAINGNVDLQNSFNQLGKSMSDLLSNKSVEEFGGEMLSVLGKNVGNGASGLNREAVQNITGGTPEQYIQDISNMFGKGTLKSKIEEGKKLGEIVGSENISSMSETMNEVGMTLKNLMQEFIPIFKILLGLFNTFINSLSGVMFSLNETGNILLNVFRAEWSKAAQNIKNIFVGSNEPPRDPFRKKLAR